jgi:hypothetical protein
MQFKERTLAQIADMICGNSEAGVPQFFRYRSSTYLSEFFEDCETDYRHDGTTRKWWVVGALRQIFQEPQPYPNTPPPAFARVIRTLMDQSDAVDEGPERPGALSALNTALAREGFEAFYRDRQCYLRHVASNTVAEPSPNPHRPFSATELKRREQLLSYMERISEDELIEEILLPLFRQLGFHRVTAAGHKDKALEYGKDIWMKHTLATQHVLYFGIQTKKGKIDSAGASKGNTANVAELLNQVTMMLGHEIFLRPADVFWSITRLSSLAAKRRSSFEHRPPRGRYRIRGSRRPCPI